MGLRITPDNLFVQRQIGASTNRMQIGFRRLSSGLRITRAGEDAAGLAIAEGLRAGVLAAQTERNNIQMATSLVQTAEGGLAQTGDALQRLRELALQASSGTLNDEQRAAINEEAQQLIEQVNQNAETTEFNEINPLAGDVTEVEVGTEGGMTVAFEAATAEALGIADIDLTTAEGAQAAIGTIDAAIGQVNQFRGQLGATQNALQTAGETRAIVAENLAAAESAIRDANMALEATNLIRDQMLQRGGIAVLSQANIMPQNALRLLGGT
jgi:flagellin